MRDQCEPDPTGPASPVRQGPSHFSLWDLDTGTSLGAYDTREEVLGIARALIEANGEAYADDLTIALESDQGHIENVATGEELLALAGLLPPVGAD